MIINRGDDLILRLHLKDDKGKRIRVEEKPSFYVKVFTSNKKNCLLYYKEQIKINENYDSIYISDEELAKLEAGVIAYIYGWGIADSNFDDMEYNRSQTTYTNFYFKNDEPLPTPPPTIVTPPSDTNEYSAYCGTLWNEDLPTLVMDKPYLTRLLGNKLADVGKVDGCNVLWDMDREEGNKSFNIFILVPANYPDLFVMDCTTQQFTIGAFNIYKDIPIEFNNKMVNYTLYVYKQDVYRGSARFRFGFKEDIRSYIKEHPIKEVNTDVAYRLEQEIMRATTREQEIEDKVDNMIYLDGERLYINTQKNG